jgi:hypothetical protein
MIQFPHGHNDSSGDQVPKGSTSFGGGGGGESGIGGELCSEALGVTDLCCNTPTTPGLAIVTPGSPLGLAPQTNTSLFYVLLSSLVRSQKDFSIDHPS